MTGIREVGRGRVTQSSAGPAGEAGLGFGHNGQALGGGEAGCAEI